MKPHRTIFSLLPLLTLGLLLVPQVSFATISDDIQGVIYYFVVEFFGMFVWFGAMLLNFGINQFVIGFGDVFNNSGIGVAVNNTWVIIRDFVNLGFIFGLVYIGLRMILDSSNSNTRRWLANLIIAALLVNFSLFATKFVVDMSNKLATEIACAGLTYPTSDDENASPSYCRDGLYRIDAGSALMARMGLITVFSQGKDAKPDGSGWGYIFGTAILFLVAAFVFAAGGILLFIRFAVLNLYLVFSAVMFIGWVIPGIPDQMRSYWKGFLSRAFFAPLYLMMLYFSFKIIDGLQQSIRTQGDGTSGTDFANPNWQQTLSKNPADNPADATLGTLPFFVLICIFLIASLVIAQKLGADGAGKAVSIGKKLRDKGIGYTKRAGAGATVGAAASLGRNTFGRYGNRLANSGDLKLAAQQGGLRGAAARAKLATASYAAGASFDARRVAGVGKELGIGEGKKGGFKQRLEDDAKKAKKYADGLGTVDIDSEEGKKRVQTETNNRKQEANQKLGKIASEQNEFDKDKLRTEDELTAAILALTAEIKEEEKALEDGIKNGTLTGTEQANRRAAIDNKKTGLDSKQNNMEVAKRNSDLQRAKLDMSLAESNGASEKEKTEAREALQKAEAAYAAEADRRQEELGLARESAQSDSNNAESNSKAAIKYERQIAFMERQRRSSENWSSKLSVGSGGAGSAILGTAAGIGGALGYGLVGGAAVSAKGASYANIVKELEKEYGKEGTKKMKKDKRVQDKKDRIEAEKDLDDDKDAKKKAADGDTKEEA